MVINASPRAQDDESPADAVAALAARSIVAALIDDEHGLDKLTLGSMPQLALVDVSSMPEATVRQCVQRCSQMALPVIALVPPNRVADLDLSLELNDFVVSPAEPDELITRAHRVLRRAGAVQDEDVVRVGDLTINPSTYEVSVRGRRVNLRFKEYELLRLLATNPGRVYTRDVLLSRIWGYDYFGGTRTVDVHVRRLRSKIEDADHSFIETIWNVGYRFRDVSNA